MDRVEISPSCPADHHRRMKNDEFLAKYASGTLRHGAALGFQHLDMLRYERLAFEFGRNWDTAPRSRVTWGRVNITSDTKVLTELVWDFRRLLAMSRFPEDRFEVAYISYTDRDGEVHKGAGVILRESSIPFIADGQVVFCIAAPEGPDGEFTGEFYTLF